jgi:hypothetical protein
MSKLKIGDKVIITNTDCIYPNYWIMVEILSSLRFKKLNSVKEFYLKEGIIKNIYQGMNYTYILLDMGDFEIIIDSSGLNFLIPRIKEYGIVKFVKKYYK